MVLLERDRDACWRSLIARFQPRFRAYVRRLQCADEEVEQIVWDVWQMAVEHEAEILSASDPWLVLGPLLKLRCRERVRVWRHERPWTDAEFGAVVVPEISETATAESFPENWVDSALRSLPYKQRFAIDYRIRWGWPYWAVAGAIGTTEGAARVCVARGLQALRKLAVSPGGTPVKKTKAPGRRRPGGNNPM